MSIEDYYRGEIEKAKKDIQSKSDEEILLLETEKLVEYYVGRIALPFVEKDERRKLIWEKLKPRPITAGRRDIIIGRNIRIRINYPITPYDKINEVLSRQSNPFWQGYGINYSNGNIILEVEISGEGSGQESRIDKKVKDLEKNLGWRNKNVKTGNERIKSELTTFISSYKDRIKKDTDLVSSLIEKVPIVIVKKDNGKVKPIDIRVKKKILPIYPKAEKAKEPFLEIDKIEAIIELLNNQGHQFEVTPEVYSKLEEEELRNIMLGMLNAIYVGTATGETFVKKGKTDIHMIVDKGSILSAECKKWDGKELYLKTIDQLFDYLIWRQNYGIIISFSNRKGFTAVIKNAKEATIAHDTIIKESLVEKDVSHFVSTHRFPEDASKSVIIHHLLFNLYI